MSFDLSAKLYANIIIYLTHLVTICMLGLFLLLVLSGSAQQYERGDGDHSYVISEERLKEIRSQSMYPFFRNGGSDANGDFQSSIRDTQPQVNKQLNFLLPFMGFGFNYTWLSLHGFVLGLKLILVFYPSPIPHIIFQSIH